MAERDIVLDIQGLSHWFGDNRVLHDVHLDIARGGIVGLDGLADAEPGHGDQSGHGQQPEQEHENRDKHLQQADAAPGTRNAERGMRNAERHWIGLCGEGLCHLTVPPC